MDHDLQQQVLRTDVAGMPLEWIGYQDAARLISLNQVSYALGRIVYRIHGGISALTGARSFIDVNAIIASHGRHPHAHLFSQSYTPPLGNQALFRRDQSLCLYCGEQFPNFQLSRDHVRPLSQGGQDIWGNVVTACKRCNNFKAGRTPGTGRNGVARHSFYTHPCRIRLPAGAKNPGGPDEFSAGPFPAQQSAAKTGGTGPATDQLKNPHSGATAIADESAPTSAFLWERFQSRSNPGNNSRINLLLRPQAALA
jgi:hypothetical protein